MDLAGWIQVLSIIGALIVILGFYGKLIKELTLTKSSAKAANIRLDKIESTEDNCVMGNKIMEAVQDHETRIRKIEDSGARTEEHVKVIKEQLKNVNDKLDRLISLKE